MPAEEVEHRHRTVTVIAPCVLKDVWVIDFRVRGAVSVVLGRAAGHYKRSFKLRIVTLTARNPDDTGKPYDNSFY
jgi:hypothetical protein